MKVKAKPGVLVPREENPRRYVSDSETLDVAESAYYLRRISDGDLLRVTDTQPAAAKTVKTAAAEQPVVPAATQQAASEGEK